MAVVAACVVVRFFSLISLLNIHLLTRVVYTPNDDSPGDFASPPKVIFWDRLHPLPKLVY